VTGVDYSDLRVVIKVNGDTVATGRTSQLLNNPAQLVSYLSRYVTLLPGDLIYTGTYPTVTGKENTVHPGDVVEVEIEQLGLLRSKIVPMNAPLPAPVTAATASRSADPRRRRQLSRCSLARELPEQLILDQSGISRPQRSRLDRASPSHGHRARSGRRAAAAVGRLLYPRAAGDRIRPGGQRRSVVGRGRRRERTALAALGAWGSRRWRRQCVDRFEQQRRSCGVEIQPGGQVASPARTAG
jgi:hypothetical protein